MRDLLLIIGYTLKGSAVFPFRGKRGGALAPIVAVVLFAMMLGLPVYLMNFESTRFLLRFGINELVRMNISFWSFGISLISIATFTPFLMYDIFASDDVEFLTTLPVTRFEIVLLAVLVSLITNSMMPVAYVFGLLGYSVATSHGVLWPIFVALMNVIMIVGLSLLLAISLSRFSKKSMRRLNMYIFLADLVIVVLMIQFNPATLGGKKFVEMIEKFTFMKEILMSRFNPFFWPVLALEDPLYSIPILAISAVSFSVSAALSRKLDFSISTQGGGIFEGKGFGMFSKDLRLALRKEQFFFFLVYPLVFSLVYGIFTSDPGVTLSINAVFSVFYSSVMGAYLMQVEYESRPLYMTFPLNKFAVIFPKISIPAVLYSPVFVSLSVVSFIMGLRLEKALLCSIFMVVAYLFSSTAGVVEFIRKPRTGRVVLPLLSLMKVEILSVGSVLVGLVYGLIYPRSKNFYRMILGTELADFFKNYGTPLSLVFMCALLFKWSVDLMVGKKDQVFHQ